MCVFSEIFVGHIKKKVKKDWSKHIPFLSVYCSNNIFSQRFFNVIIIQFLYNTDYLFNYCSYFV